MPVSMRRWRSCSAAVPPPALPWTAASGLPGEWDEFVSRELGAALALSSGDAEEVLALAAALEVSLPGTRAAFRSGVLTRDKALIIAVGDHVAGSGGGRVPRRRWSWTGPGR